MEWWKSYKDKDKENGQNINISEDIEFREPWRNPYGPPEKKIMKIMIPVSCIWEWGKKLFKK